MDKEIKLSEKEQVLLDHIRVSTTEVTAVKITEELGEKYLGAIGHLIQYELIEIKKKTMVDASNRYGTKWTKYYIIIDKEIS